MLEDGSLIVTRWNDNVPVTLISSLLGDKPLAAASRYSRAVQKYTNVPQPHVINQYNKYMGGVDRFDQNNNHLRISIGGKKWYWSVITWLLDTAVQNAWQLSKKAGSELSLLDFKREIVCTILRGASSSRRSSQSGPLGARPGDNVRYDRLDHLPVWRSQRRLCAMEECKVKCVTFCDKCDRALCKDHFKSYHTI